MNYEYLLLAYPAILLTSSNKMKRTIIILQLNRILQQNLLHFFAFHFFLAVRITRDYSVTSKIVDCQLRRISEGLSEGPKERLRRDGAEGSIEGSHGFGCVRFLDLPIGRVAPGDDKLVNFYVTKVIITPYSRGGIAASERRGFHVSISSQDDDMETMPLIVTRQKVDGLILTGSRLSKDFCRNIKPLLDAVPVVLLNKLMVDPPMNAVIVDNLLMMQMAVSHLAELGHRRIAYFDAERQFYSSLRNYHWGGLYHEYLHTIFMPFG